MTVTPIENFHEVHFYDSVFPTLAIADFLQVGLVVGESALVVATTDHRSQIKKELERRGVPIRDYDATGRWQVLDAETVASVVKADATNELWDTLVGGSTRKALASAANGRVRIYGEVADILVREGHAGLAMSLEEISNVTVSANPVRVICGYSKQSFPDAGTARDLMKACLLHDAIRSDLEGPEDWRVQLIAAAGRDKRH